MNTKIKIAIIIILFLTFIYYIESNKKKDICFYYNEYLKKSFNGVIIKKFIDSNEHSFPYLYVKNVDGSLYKLELFNDKSGLYNVVHLNDTISKEKDTPSVFKRSGNSLIKLKTVDFGCSN